MSLRLALVVACIVGVLVAPSVASAHDWYAPARAHCAHATAPMRCYHNWVRVHKGLHRLHGHWRLYRSARYKARRIVHCGGTPTHTPCGDSVLRPFYQSGYLPWWLWVAWENLAWGWPTRWAAFHALMHSGLHREAILDPRVRDYGARHRPSPWGTLWVLHYGRRY